MFNFDWWSWKAFALGCILTSCFHLYRYYFVIKPREDAKKKSLTDRIDVLTGKNINKPKYDDLLFKGDF